MQTGITLLVIFSVVTLSQLFMQGLERRRQHKEILERLSQLEAKLDR